MSGMNLVQVFASNPITTNSATDLMYFESGGVDAAMHYSDFAAQFPGKTGTGASGTWGISISGNAATASAVAVGGITGLGTGVATALGINVGSAGAFVTFNGAGGTPSSMTATNLTGTAAGLTAGTASAVAVGGITGLGTGVATALAINIGTAGSFVTNGGALGTPSSGVLTNMTGTQKGTTTNDSAAAGQVGQFVSSNIAVGSAVTATSNADFDVTSISLTAGDWDVWGNVMFASVGSVPTLLKGWINTSSASPPDQSLTAILTVTGIAANNGFVVPYQRISLASSGTAYLSGHLSNTSGNGTICGSIYARRAR